jgi:hypothetical protein
MTPTDQPINLPPLPSDLSISYLAAKAKNPAPDTADRYIDVLADRAAQSEAQSPQGGEAAQAEPVCERRRCRLHDACYGHCLKTDATPAAAQAGAPGRSEREGPVALENRLMGLAAHLRMGSAPELVAAILDEVAGRSEHAVPEPSDRVRLRAAQAAAVMPMIGLLLDAWEHARHHIVNDRECTELSKQLRAINRAMEEAGDDHE